MDTRRLPLLAVLFLVVLRISIGWQFLYEGMWKYDSLDSPDPWTAEGYLKNAQGPFRDTFRNMVGDPDELDWLDYTKVSAKWYDWRNRFAAHYHLDADQVARLNRLLDGVSESLTDPAADPVGPVVQVEVDGLPTGVDLAARSLNKTFSYDAKVNRLRVEQPVLPSEEQALLAQAKADDAAAFREAVKKLCADSRKVSYRHRLAAQLRGNPEFVGVTGALNERGSFDIVMGTTTAAEESRERTSVAYGKIQEYKDLLHEYEEALSRAKIDYQYDHASKLKTKLSILRNEVVGPVKTLDTELREEAFKLLSVEQLAHGAMPMEDTPLWRASSKAMWGLLILGTLLIIGLGTRIAALAGAFMLLNFYLVVPPWPGVPQPPSPEHSLIINKNLIEVIALLAIAAMPTGTWFGIDGLIGRLWKGSKKPATAKG
ncbi:MAG: DoxX family membrane protein [Planctomycetaceae bacterium]|nr:DoxX family membrane protein [Planctomycetaceae bacterium]